MKNVNKWIYVGSLSGLFVFAIFCSGCGTMKTTNTSRTATEQLLVTNAIDKAIDEIDFRVLSGKTVFLDSAPASGATDTAYLSSAIRQQLMANGAQLKEKKEDAEIVVELRAGGIGTDENEVVYGIPELTAPTGITGGSISLPEFAIAKKLGQTAYAKIAIFAYDRATGTPIWQSGTAQQEAKVKSLWVLGGGPYRKGEILEPPKYAGRIEAAPIVNPTNQNASVAVNNQALFVQHKSAEKPAETVAQKETPANPAAAAEKSSVEAKPAVAPAMAAAPVVPAGNVPPVYTPLPQSAAPAVPDIPDYMQPTATMATAPQNTVR